MNNTKDERAPARQKKTDWWQTDGKTETDRALPSDPAPTFLVKTYRLLADRRADRNRQGTHI